MEVGAAGHKKAGLFALRWLWLKALFEMFRNKIVAVVNKTKQTGKDDPRRIIHAIKVGLALVIISVFYDFRAVYNGFGDSAIWAVLTVVVVFEFTVGGTIGKSLNRGFATFLAGALGVGTDHLASLAGQKGEPIVLGISVFILGGGATFSRFFPSIKARYDYGVVIFILTFSLVSVSGYRVDQILTMAQQRLTTIIIGVSVCMIISVVVCPVWAGEDLHKLVALNMEKLADFLEGFGAEYFENEQDGEIAEVPKKEKTFLKGYKSVLNSKTSEESLANFARWEPGHGGFRFGYPWKQYLKVGALTRQCAYRIEALNSYINSDHQTPPEFKEKIQEACTKMSSESGKALRELASGIRAMTHTNAADIQVTKSKNAVDDLKSTTTITLPANINLLEVIPAATVTSLLTEIVAFIEEIAESVHELALQGKFKIVDPTITPDKTHQHILHRGIVKPVSESPSATPQVVITICESSPPQTNNVKIQEPSRVQPEVV